MKLIVAVDAGWAIGKDNKLLVSIPEDMKFFRETTTGNIVVMGRKTLESFPGGRPLKNRTNIVLTRNTEYAPEGVTVVHDIEELKTVIGGGSAPDGTCDMNGNEAPDGTKEVFVIGGASVYKELLPLCDTAYITRIDKKFDADAFFTNLDESPGWFLSGESEPASWEGITYRFATYKNMLLT